MNPYASYLSNQNSRDVIAATTAKLEALTSGLTDAQLTASPAPGKWSIRDILSHLADCEIVFAYRIRQSLSEPHHLIQPFDQDTWAKPYGTYTPAAALATFAAVRTWNVQLVGNLPAEALQRPLTHPERGTMVLQTIVETMGGHDINHLRQIESIVSRAASA